jgi:hypothetical protein
VTDRRRINLNSAQSDMVRWRLALRRPGRRLRRQIEVREEVFRDPVYSARPATAITPATGIPLVFGRSTLSISAGLNRFARPATLQTEITSRTVRTVPVSGITLRAAIGPMRYGITTFRLRPDSPADSLTEPPTLITPDGLLRRHVTFAIALEDHPPGVLSLSSRMHIVFTLERLEDNEGHVVFENPGATELLWEALGRPTLSR